MSVLPRSRKYRRFPITRLRLLDMSPHTRKRLGLALTTCAVTLASLRTMVPAAEPSLRTRVLLEFGKLVPPRLEEPAVTYAGDRYALGFRSATAGPYSVAIQKDLVYDPYYHLQLDIYRPESVSTPLPTVVLVHGGGWKYFTKAAAAGYARFLATHGFAAVAVDYRLSTEARWPAQLEDLVKAMYWLGEHATELGIDPNRVAAMGDSAGGHLAAMLGVSGAGPTKQGLAAVVAYYGVYDMVSLLSFDDTARINPINQLIGSTSDPVFTGRLASPLYRVGSKTPPFLLVHGLDDSVVPVEQTQTFAAALQEAGVPVQVIYVEGADHLLLGWPTELNPSLEEIDRTVIDFLREKLSATPDTNNPTPTL